MKLLVCGGAGFIGSNFARQRLREAGDEVTVLDKLTYAGPARRTSPTCATTRGFAFVRAGIEDADAVDAAVDGRRRGRQLRRRDARRPLDLRARRVHHDARARARSCCWRPRGAHGMRYVQVSTDEVYGSIEEGSFTEESPLQPSSPYSATKAGADLLVASYHHTYGLEALICRGSNNYGPYQYPEKLIPLMVLNALHGDQLPVYGDGQQVRNWIFVEDFARGIGHVLAHGAPGETYNVGGPDEAVNLDVVQRIIALTGASEDLIEYVTDRPGHDRRYSLGSEKARALGWEPQVRFDEGLERTVAWYRDNTRLVGADPLGRLPRLLRAPVRARAGLS